MAKKKKVEFPQIVYMDDVSEYGHWTTEKIEDLDGKTGQPVAIYHLAGLRKIKRVKRMVEKDVAELE